MPEISLFYGIRITMYWSDHNPPHFHAEYGNNRAIILIEDGIVSEGYLPKRQSDTPMQASGYLTLAAVAKYPRKRVYLARCFAGIKVCTCVDGNS